LYHPFYYQFETVRGESTSGPSTKGIIDVPGTRY
jgi:hypothetical protein